MHTSIHSLARRCTAVLATGLTLGLVSCSSTDEPTTTGNSTGNGTTGTSTSEVTTSTSDASDTSFVNEVTITFSGTTATVSGSVTGVTATTSGGVVTITSTAEQVNYIVTGTTTAGGLDITSSAPLMITLNGAGITRSGAAPIQVSSSVDTYVKALSGSSNSLADDASNTTTGATLYTKGTLYLVGAGALSLQGNAVDAIQSAGGVSLSDMSLTVLGAVQDGIQAKGAFSMESGKLALTSTTADAKGVKAGGDITIAGGTVEMTVSGAQSKGFKSGLATSITGGTITVTTSGDAVLEASGSGYDPSYCTAFKSDTDIIISGGTINVTSTGAGGKGFSPDGDFLMSGGNVTINTSGGGATYTDADGATDAYSATGISPDGTCTLSGGVLYIKSTGAAGNGISADGDLIIGESTTSTGPTVEVYTTGARFYVSGSGDSADYANPKAIKSDANVTVNSGTITIACSQTGGEGLESKATLTVNGGTLTIQTIDDCINASSAAYFNGGKVYCYATGNDAIDSNGTLSVTGGLVVAISSATAPETGIDCDQSAFSITGGTLIGIGKASHSAPSSSSTTQRTVLYNGLSMTGGSLLAVNSSAGTNLATLKLPSLNYTSGSLLLSHADLAAGTTYTVYRGGSYANATSDFSGYYTGGTYTAGTSSGTFTPSSSSTITTVGTSSGGRRF